MKLMFQALIKFAAGVLLSGILLFLPAGTLAYLGAWQCMILLFVPMLIFGAVLLVRAPDLLKKRLNTHEKENAQKGIVALAALMFVAVFVLAGLDFRFGWTRVSAPLNVAACALMLIAYLLYIEVMRENAWLSRTVEVQQGQKVVDTGLYGVVRHPMYMAMVLLFLAIPLVLGSVVSFVVCLLYVPIIVLRIRGEEAVLKRELAGYEAYMEKVRFRLLPFIW